MSDADFLSVMEARHCKRVFEDREVPRAVLERVLTAAANAPSTRNTQFWQVAVLTGAAKAELARRLCAEFDAGTPRRPDYVNRPAAMAEVYQRRSQDWGAGMYGTVGIARDDAAGRRRQDRNNYAFYGAPVAMIFHLPADAVPGTFLEMGCFLQNVLLGLVASGLGGCPQYSVAGYSDTIREFLRLGPDRLVVCGLSVGYVDESAPLNHFHPPRAALGAYTSWYSHAPSAVDSA